MASGDPRGVANSASISEHSFGNACDIYGTRQGMETLAAFLWDNKGKYEIRLLCYDPGPGRKYQSCTTKHVDHIHVDFPPKCGGKVSADGSATERARRCSEYQGPMSGDTGGIDNRTWWERFFGRPLEYDIETGEIVPGGDGAPLSPVDDEGGLDLNPLAGVADAIQSSVMTAAVVGIGIVLVVVGTVLAIKDTELGKMAVTAATKGKL